MKILELTASASRKVNLGNYESADFFAAAKAEPDSTDTPAAVLAQLQKLVDEHVDLQVRTKLTPGTVKLAR